MGKRQTYRGDPESKLFYLVDQLIGGINTDFSDDTSPDNEFEELINFDMDKRGSLHKRMGFGKLNAVSQIFNMFENVPNVKVITPEDPNPEETNDNIVYMKMLRNDNNCFRTLSAFTGSYAYREYQKVYGSQNNTFELLVITTNKYENTSRAWYFKCTLTPYTDEDAELGDTIYLENSYIDLPVIFNWNKNLSNIDTIEFFDKIYFTSNDSCLVCYDRTLNKFTYSGAALGDNANEAYKPSPMEIRKVGFNVIGEDPLHWVNYSDISTDSIQGIYLTTEDNKPLNVIPNGGSFKLNILFTGEATDFNVTFKEGETELSVNTTVDEDLTQEGLRVLNVTFTTVPTSEVEIKVEKTTSNIDPYYDYYEVGMIDPETKPIEHLNIGDYGICEMYNRAVYYKDDTIWFSEINNFSYVPNYNYVSLPIEPTDKITKIVFFKNVYIVFTKNRIYKMINSFGASDFQVMPVNLSIGCHAPGTVIPVENELYFASPRGLYALKSSEFREGIENLKELDTKIKNITSDVTKYLGEKSDPSVRYNGIPERAYAIRYKDKYMLFLNSSSENGDLELQDIDVLVYQYELRAFSEIRFSVKPTFLFMVDGALETLCSIPVKEIYTESQTLLDYDLTTTGENGEIVDNSENNYSSYTTGDVVTNPGAGVSITSGEISLANIPSSINLLDGFDVKLKCTLDDVRDGMLYSLKRATQQGIKNTKSFSMQTAYNNGYSLKANFIAITDSSTGKSTVSYVLYLLRQSTSISASNDGKYKLMDANGNALIAETSYNVTFSDSNLSLTLNEGSFTINHSNNEDYSGVWSLNLNTYYTTTTTEWVKGAKTTFSKTIPASFDDNIYIKLVGEATAYDGGATVKVTPTFGLYKYSSIASGTRSFFTTINGGTALESSLGKLNGTGPCEFTGPAVSKNIAYSGGTKTIKIDGYLDFRTSWAGVTRSTIEIDAFDFTLPSVTQKTITTKTYEDMYVSGAVNLVMTYDNSYDEISMYIINGTALEFGCASVNGGDSYFEDFYESFNGEHDFLVTYRVVNDEWLVTVYDNDYELTSTTFPYNYILNTNRDGSALMNIGVSILSEFKITLVDGTVVTEFDIASSTGTKINDKSGNNIYGVISDGMSIVTEAGTKFGGNDGYVKIPTIPDSVRFSDGFTIEFEAKFDNKTSGVCKVIDLATSYDSSSSNTNNCSINISANFANKSLGLYTTSANGKSYNVVATDLDLFTRHKWTFEVKDNGEKYDISIYCDDILIKTSQYNYGGITNITRRSNYLGKSNNTSDDYFSGYLYNMKISIDGSVDSIPVYESAMYEYDTTYDDFGRPMDLSLTTKGINLQYAMHLKKLKHVFVKGLGGFNYNELFFELYVDGHLQNDPKVFNCYIDEFTNQVVYDYTEVKELTFNEMSSLLGNMRLGKTKLGESDYETRKLIIPGKGKNFTIKIYGESSDSLSIDSFGFIYKLGKVKE